MSTEDDFGFGEDEGSTKRDYSICEACGKPRKANMMFYKYKEGSSASKIALCTSHQIEMWQHGEDFMMRHYPKLAMGRKCETPGRHLKRSDLD